MEIRFATMKDIDTLYFYDKHIGKQELEYSNVMTSTASNEYAQHFYNKLGYIAVGGFSPVGEPYEIILSKVL